MYNISLGFAPQKRTLSRDKMRLTSTKKVQDLAYLNHLLCYGAYIGLLQCKVIPPIDSPRVFHFGLKERILKLREQIRKQKSLMKNP